MRDLDVSDRGEHGALRATFVSGRTSYGLANNGPLQIIEEQPGRQHYWCTNLKRLGFDPITEIIRNLFRFHLGNDQHR